MTEVTIAREKSFEGLGPVPVEPERTVSPRPSLEEALWSACGRIAPLWPLESFVAVNPFLGLTGDTFPEACARMRRVAGVSMLMPRSFYREALATGRITDRDLALAIERMGARLTVEALKAVATQDSPAPRPEAATVAEVLDQAHGTSWAATVQAEISRWCSAFFDQGQATWAMPWRDQSLHAAWRAAARHDRTPEVLGLAGFRALIAELPEDPVQVIAAVLELLEVPAEAAEAYLHRALLGIGGWASYVRYRGWAAELSGERSTGLIELLAIRLSWEWALQAHLAPEDTRRAWRTAVERMAAPSPRASTEPQELPELVLQQAFELAFQRELTSRIQRGGTPAPHERPSVQAVFCIDVRSEVYRRALETVSPRTETLGFAGFFGFPIEYVPLGGRHGTAQCPVLLTPSITVREAVAGANEAELDRLTGLRLMRRRLEALWSSFKASAVSCFSFVEAAGLGYAARLVGDSLGLPAAGERPRTSGLAPEVHGRLGPRLEPEEHEGRRTGLTLDRRIASAESMLKGMSLRSGFARLVMLCGHGSTTVNNPHAAGLDCGACGGNTGEANARLAAAILNDPSVRAGLAERGIELPTDTWFLAALHDTTTDDLSLFDVERVPASHVADLEALRGSLERASQLARAERAKRFGQFGPHGLDEAVRRRSRDWAQVRPEWGLAGNASFIAAPRARTRGLNLEGRAFLHSYDWRQDETGAILKLIMTAPMVVANWINLQYFGSTVNNAAFGSGNKVLHNVVGRLGVLQGHGGDLQTGLPHQSVHDGQRFVHEPLRLNVFIEAPEEAMNRVLAAHPEVRRLVDNGWLHLFALGEDGRRIRRYAGALRWTELDADARAAPGTQGALGRA